MHLTKSSTSGIVILRGHHGETRDAFSTQEAREKFCNIAINILEQDGGYMISQCIEKCKHQCLYVVSLSVNKGM